VTKHTDIPLIDVHIHVRTVASIANQVDVMEACNLAAVNVLSVPPHGGLNINQNVLGALFKALWPDRVYWFCGVHHGPPAVPADRPDFAAQLRTLREMGCDGVKMIEGKPTVYKQLGTPLNDRLYDEFYGLLESERIPLLFHVGDPSKNWDPNRVSQQTRARGWFYGDGTFPARKTLYKEIDDVLARFPRLTVIFAHFYFFEDQIARADEFMSRWENVGVDLTPGWTMYSCFSRAPDAWREFFVKWQDRIFFGTDNSGGRTSPRPEKVEIALDKIGKMRTFLETADEVAYDEKTKFRGINLDRPVLENIYHANFERVAGEKPRAVNVPLAVERARELLSLARAGGADDETLTDLTNILSRLESL